MFGPYAGQYTYRQPAQLNELEMGQQVDVLIVAEDMSERSILVPRLLTGTELRQHMIGGAVQGGAAAAAAASAAAVNSLTVTILTADLTARGLPRLT